MKDLNARLPGPGYRLAACAAVAMAGLALLGAGCAGKAARPAALAAEVPTPDSIANAFFERAQDEYYQLNPTTAATLGYRLRYGEWTDNSEAGDRARLKLARRHLAELRDIDRASLGADAQLSWDIFEYLQEQRIRSYRWRNHSYVFAKSGPHTSLPAFLVNSHRVEDEADALAYISRLAGIHEYVATALARARDAEERGVLPPAFVFGYVESDARNVITGRPFDAGPGDSPLLADFRAKVQALDLPEERRGELVAAAEAALVASVGPAYEAVIDWARSAATRATADDGVWKLPHGAAYYDHLLAQYTTTGLTAAQVHDIGLREVARIHEEMRAIMTRVGFDGDLQDFFAFVRNDDRFYYPDTPEGRAAYLARATYIIDTMRKRLPDLFLTVPQADIVVKAVEPFREKSAGKAFYQRPSADGSRPGTYYANLHDMREMPTTEMEALAYHEGIPGHHMQIAIAGEQAALPRFRRFGGFTAFSEGWGLYSERLPKEIGFYADPYSDFGRLTLELVRAVRLVVDTGLHAKHWTREDVIRYHLENTPLPEGAVVRATERYILNPGQATAYTVGMLKILELRERAAGALGERFDLRAFHDVILRNGGLPLTLLEQQVERWIDGARE